VQKKPGAHTHVCKITGLDFLLATTLRAACMLAVVVGSTRATPMDEDDIAGRIRDDDELIVLDETRAIMGGISVSTAYEDPELMGLKVNMSAGDRRSHLIRFIKREILALRAERVARAEANAPNIRAQTEARVEQRRARQRLNRGLQRAVNPEPAQK
jgi:hypothetical protein